MTQSHAHSLIEAITNVAVGYMLAVVTQILVFPMFGWHPVNPSVNWGQRPGVK